MTILEAKQILMTYKMPMTSDEMLEFRKAFLIISGFWGRRLF